jgi:hypothetical protein
MQPGRPGGLPAMAGPKSSLAAASKLALWPGYGLALGQELRNNAGTPARDIKSAL